MVEIWKDIPGYEDLYQASNLGNIKGLSRIMLINGKYPIMTKERIFSPAKNCHGYLFVNLTKDKKKKGFKVHQLVAMAFLEHIPCGHKLVVNHKNFIRTDNRLENLEVITGRENYNRKHLKSSSKYVGVSWNKVLEKWSSTIFVNGKTKHLGYFVNELDASKTYQKKLSEIKINEIIVIDPITVTPEKCSLCNSFPNTNCIDCNP